MRTSPATYRRILRRLFAAMTAPEVSDSEIAAAIKELNHGQITYELSELLETFMYRSNLNNSESEVETIVSDIENAAKQKGIRKEELISILNSLQNTRVTPSTRTPLREIITSFVIDTPDRQISKLIETIEATRPDDDFLSGVSKRER